MSDLTIPVAMTEDGLIVHAHEGNKTDRFCCPGCKSLVVWRRCDDVSRRSHFAHLPDSICSESAIHAAAKMLAAQQVNRWIAGEGRRPLVVPSCSHWRATYSSRGACMERSPCGDECEPRPFDLHPDTTAVVEATLASGLRPDVLVGDLAIEILHTHRIEEDKIQRYAEDRIRWLEVRADGLLEDPSVWRLERSSEGKSVCVSCSRAEERDRLHRQAETLEGKIRALEERERDRVSFVEASERALSKREADASAKMAALDSSIRDRTVAAREIEEKIRARLRQLETEEVKLCSGRRVWLVLPAKGGFVRERSGRAIDSDGDWVHWIDDEGADHFSKPSALRWVAEESK